MKLDHFLSPLIPTGIQYLQQTIFKSELKSGKFERATLYIKRGKNFYGPERNAFWWKGEEEQLLNKERTAYFSVVLWLQSVYTSKVGYRHISDFVAVRSTWKRLTAISESNPYNRLHLQIDIEI
jgi:hypothetical protein